jgi:uncharacterized membrane protein YraQ (UPF0718 family)
MTTRLVVDIILWSTVCIVGFFAFRRSKTMFRKAVKDGAIDFVTVIPRIAIGVIGSGYIAAVVPSELITSWLGPQTGWLGIAAATLAGALTPGGAVIGFSVGAVALKSGAGFPHIIAYVVAWALFSFQRVIIWEIPFMPPRFVWFRAAVSTPFPFLAAGVAMLLGRV